MVDLPSFLSSSCNCFCVVACEKKKNKEKNLNSCVVSYFVLSFLSNILFLFLCSWMSKRQDQTVQYRLNNKKSISKNNVEHFFLHFKRLFERKREKKRSSGHYHTAVPPALLFMMRHQTSDINHNKKKRSPNRTTN